MSAAEQVLEVQADAVQVARRVTRHRFGLLYRCCFLVGVDDTGRRVLMPLPTLPHTRWTLFIIGRASDCDLLLHSPFVSRHHARLLVATDEIVLADLGSRHGTIVNGERLDPGREQRLELGARLSFGDGELTLCSAGDAWDWVRADPRSSQWT
jgi:hypothetical protein